MSEATIKTINMVSGESIKTLSEVPGANIKEVLGVEAALAPSGDAFVTKCQDAGTLFALWTCQDQSTGDLINTGTVMTDQSGNSNPDIEVVVASTGDWQIGDAEPAGALESLAKYVSSDVNEQGTDNFAALASAITEPVTPGDAYSGFIIFYTPSLYSTTEIATFFGTTGTPAGTANGLSITNYSHWLFGSGTWMGYSNTGTSYTNPLGPIADRSDAWWFLAFRVKTGESENLTMYIQDIYDGVGEKSGWGENAASATATHDISSNPLLSTGLRLGYGSGGASPADIRWAAVGVFTDDIGVGTDGSTLRTIFETIE